MKKITIKIKSEKAPKGRSPHKPTKAQKSKKVYDRKKVKKELR